MPKLFIIFAIIFIAAGLFLGAVTGCAFDKFNDGYQFGDVSLTAGESILKLPQAIETYCTATKDSLIKQAALTIIHAQYPLIPASGICGLLYSRGG